MSDTEEDDDDPEYTIPTPKQHKKREKIDVDEVVDIIMGINQEDKENSNKCWCVSHFNRSQTLCFVKIKNIVCVVKNMQS